MQQKIIPWKAGLVARRSQIGLVPRTYRLYRYGLQGRPAKALMLREALFDWLVSIWGLCVCVCARIHPKVVLMKGKALASELLGEMRRTGDYIDLPVIDYQWLH